MRNLSQTEIEQIGGGTGIVVDPDFGKMPYDDTWPHSLDPIYVRINREWETVGTEPYIPVDRDNLP